MGERIGSYGRGAGAASADPDQCGTRRRGLFISVTPYRTSRAGQVKQEGGMLLVWTDERHYFTPTGQAGADRPAVFIEIGVLLPPLAWSVGKYI